MKIDWMALGQVAVVTLIGSVLVVGIVALATRLLDRGHIAAAEGQVDSPYHSRYAMIAYGLFVVSAGIIVLGLYLMIPYFHA